MFDALVIGAGPAGLAIASELCGQGLKVQGLIPAEPSAPWTNTYGSRPRKTLNWAILPKEKVK